jgi:hypothetical protein
VYYVRIGPADESDDAFKGQVKSVLTALAADTGGPDFSAWVFDEAKIGALTYAEAEQQPAASPDTDRSEDLKREQHLVAIYSGADPADGRAYTIRWFPAASPQSSAVGRWVGTEAWQP